MSDSLDFWKFIAGLGLFLFGMTKLEEALKELAGRRFKLFLKNYTKNRFLAIVNGAFATAVLQSSSIVMLMVIAFAGAGIVSLSNSLGIILGANLGTTMTGWLVSLFGFSMKMESFILPMIAIGSLGSIFISRRFLFYHVFGFVIAVGLLLMGLDFMKESMNQLATIVDIRQLENLGMSVYFLFGLLVTAVIHSSSTMMTITLSALFANIISLTPAAFIIIGADLGTTMTALLATARGTPVKKRIGLAHFLFNLITAAMAVIFLGPLLEFISRGLGISDPLFTLVAFHSGFNMIGIFLFVPFLNIFEKFLERFFKNGKDQACEFIHKVSAEVPEAALEAIRLELDHFLKKVFAFNCRLIGLKIEENDGNRNFHFLKFIITDDDISKEYEWIKRVEGEILEFFVALQQEKLDESESKILNQYVLALRNGVQSAKSTKDIRHNLNEFRQSVIEIVERAMSEIHKDYLPIQTRLMLTWKITNEKMLSEEFVGITTDNDQAYRRVNEWLYAAAQSVGEAELQIATFLNVNREIYISNKLLIEALGDISMSPIDAQS